MNPKPPFDAYRVIARRESGRISGIHVTRVRVRTLMPASRLAEVGYGRRLHSVCVVPFGELHSTADAALAAVAAALPQVAHTPPADA
jgi:hypothetical protein